MANKKTKIHKNASLVNCLINNNVIQTLTCFLQGSNTCYLVKYICVKLCFWVKKINMLMHFSVLIINYLDS